MNTSGMYVGETQDPTTGERCRVYVALDNGELLLFRKPRDDERDVPCTVYTSKAILRLVHGPFETGYVVDRL